jgi:type VI secretion system secreted protein Hcp
MSEIQYFLKLDCIDGESQDEQHKNEIAVEAWRWGESQAIAASGGGAGAGKAKFEELQVTLRISKASPKLLLAVASGLHIRSAILTGRRSGEPAVEFLQITLSDVLVSAFQTSATLEDGLPREQVSFNFSKIEYAYTPQNPDGSLGESVKVGWDVKVNRRV